MGSNPTGDTNRDIEEPGLSRLFRIQEHASSNLAIPTNNQSDYMNISNITNQFKTKWQDWTSVILLMIGATLLAANIPETKWAFPVLTVGRIWLSVLMWRRKDWPLFMSNFSFCLIDLVGIYRWFK